VTSAGELALLAGPFGRLDPAARRDLWDYLRAVAVDDPDRALGALLRRLVPGRRADAAELRTRFRQVAPFRDGGWSAAGDHLAEHVALHALWVPRTGFAFDGATRDFLRALFGFTHLAAGHAPTLDPWDSALERLGWSAAVAQGRRMLAPDALGRIAAGQSQLLFALPGLLERWLARVDRAEASS
ncbi:MAG: hypothetical protein AAF772_21370, partial [Acidobacteriota bacterium]